MARMNPLHIAIRQPSGARQPRSLAFGEQLHATDVGFQPGAKLRASRAGWPTIECSGSQHNRVDRESLCRQFREYWPSDHLATHAVHRSNPPLKRDKMPVASNRRCKRSWSPCNLSSVLQFRAIFNVSIRVATPELSISVTPDKSMPTVLGCGASKRAISWSRTAGEESISILPFKDARAPCSLATMLISGLSTRLLL